jgi:hypothetical protein
VSVPTADRRPPTADLAEMRLTRKQPQQKVYGPSPGSVHRTIRASAVNDRLPELVARNPNLN